MMLTDALKWYEMSQYKSKASSFFGQTFLGLITAKLRASIMIKAMSTYHDSELI